MSRANRVGVLFGVALAILSRPVLAGYTDAKQRFTFDPPAGWKMQVAPDVSGIVMLASPDERAKFIVLPLAVPAGSELPALATAYEQFLAATQEGITLKAVEDMRALVGGKRALQREYAVSKAGDEGGRLVTTFVSDGGVSVAIHAGAKGNDFAKHQATFGACIASFRFGAGGGAAAGGNAAAAAEIQAKIKALDAALQAGILSNDEYARKKAELEAQLQAAQPQIDPATAQKLKALDAALQAGILSQAEYDRKKAELVGQAAPVPGPQPPTPMPQPPFPPTPQPPQPARAGQAHRHPAGFAFWCPAEWKVQVQEGNVQLVPPNPLVTDGNPMELYVIAAENVAGQNVQRPDDPRLVQMLDTQIKAQAQALRRVEGSTAVPMGKRQGVILDWEAKLTEVVVIRARAFVGLLDTTAVVLMAVGLKDKLEARDADLRLIFGSFGTGQPPGAPGAPQPPAFPGAVPPAPPAPGPATPAAAADAPAKGKLYRHAIGFSFWHPESWAVKEVEGGLQLTPPDAVVKDGAPAEVYFVTGESVADEGIQRADDPRVAEYLDTQVRGVAPALQRVGGAEAVGMANGQGVAINWEAKSPDGSVVRARALVSIIKRHGVALIGLGLKERLDAREAVLRQMFASFGFGEGKRDPQLVGKWHLVATTSIANESPFVASWDRAQAVTETKTELAFGGDGTWQRVANRHTLVGGAGIWLEDKGRDVSNGTWNADGTSLYMMGKDDSWEQYKYQVRQTAQGREVRLASGNKGTVWRGGE